VENWLGDKTLTRDEDLTLCTASAGIVRKQKKKNLPLISTRLKRKNFSMEQLSLSFPVHLSTEVWTQVK